MPLKYLIVQIPGIGGSVLSNPGSRTAWDVTPTRIARALVRPETLALDRFPHLTPDRLIVTATVIPAVVVLPGYERMVTNLRNWFGAGLKVVDYLPGVPVPADTEVLRVPYDFRRSVREAAEVVARAVSRVDRDVVVVAHSMGGLVARYWIGPLEGWRRCHGLITLGTPHRGAPQALDWLVNGVRIGPFRHPSATRVLRGWPSVYELLPQYPAVWTEDGPIEPVDLPGACFQDEGMARDAVRTHADIAAGWAAIPAHRVPKLVPYFGRGHRTLNRASLVDGGLLVTKEDPEWRGNVGWHGDGTVPAISAIPADLGDRNEVWRAVPDKHGPMGGTPAVMDLLGVLLGDGLPTRGNLVPERPWVGFDLDDTALSGVDIPLGADLLGAPDGPGSSATVTITGEHVPRTVPFVARDGRWETVLPPLSAGLYEVTVEIKDAWFGASVYGTAPLAVVEPDEDWEAA
jgi:lecithin:cholesterol acyltransferase